MFQVRLKKLREDRGYSQYTFAKKIGVAQSTVGGWESGARQPNFEMIRKIASFFQVSVDYLLGRTDDPHPVTSNDDVKKAIDEYVKNKGKQSTVIRYNGKEQTYETLDITDEEWEIAQATIEALRLKRR